MNVINQRINMNIHETNLLKEAHRTRPDYIACTPENYKDCPLDTSNDDFIVFPAPDNSLMALWTQRYSVYSGQPELRIVISKSKDNGKTWSPPIRILGKDQNRSRDIAGTENNSGKTGMAGFGIPIISKKGRIYVFYNRHIFRNDLWADITGVLECVYSDDCGASWSLPYKLTMPRSKWDSENPATPPSWRFGLAPFRLSNGMHIAAFVKWVSPSVIASSPYGAWWGRPSLLEFMRFENIDKNPEPRNLRIKFCAQNDNALKIPLPKYPDLSSVHYPSLCELAPGRLLCSLASPCGKPYYSMSYDNGDTWSAPESMLFDNSELDFNVGCAPCPVYKINEKEILCFLTEHYCAPYESKSPVDYDSKLSRVFMAKGIIESNSARLFHFSKPELFLENNGVPLDFGNGEWRDISLHSSMSRPGKDQEYVLWYCDRGVFILGKNISD
jgi:hypothetical protein